MPIGYLGSESSVPSKVEGLPCIVNGMYFVYMIKNSSNKLYVGISQNPENRVKYHNKKWGAKFTKYTSDFKVVFLEKCESLALARKREIQIKKWRRSKKDELVTRYSQGLETKI